jgi:hypothetical protein
MSDWFHLHVGPFLPLMELKWLKFGKEWNKLFKFESGRDN